MKVWIFVEGESDRIALNSLWQNWVIELRKQGCGIQPIPLNNKAQFFRKIGPRAAEKLVANEADVVVGLPDLYPNHEYHNSHYRHRDLDELKQLQTTLVAKALSDVYHCSPMQLPRLLDRFYPTALKHDCEMLLLAAKDELRTVLGTSDALGNWRNPVEDQNQQKPPKYVVRELFKTRAGRNYRETTDAKAILDRVTDIKTVLYRQGNSPQCPVFKDLIDWMGNRTGVRAYI